MAATFQSAASDAVVDDADTSLVVTKPSGLAVGDLMVAVASSTDSRTVAPPGGWTTFEDTSNGTNRTSVHTKIADAGDAAASNFTFTTSAGFSNASVALLRISGAIATGIVTAYNTGANDTTVTCANVTTVADGSLVIWGAHQVANSGPATIPGPAVERVDVSSVAAGWLFAATEDRPTAGTATGPVITKTGFSAARAYSIAISPSGGGGGGVTESQLERGTRGVGRGVMRGAV